jgi:DNA (cytosine-5)-methyltransferase 1
VKVVSFFAGCGGLDLGFEQAGYEVIWANEFDKSIHETYQLNHPNTFLFKSDIKILTAENIPDCDGFIGGPPCQPWSVGGKQLGLEDNRGGLFLDYIRLIKEKHPKFFIIENVQGIISDKHFNTFLSFLLMLENTGYIVNYSLLNAADFRIPQDRFRIFIVGVSKDLHCNFKFPRPIADTVCLRQAIGDITEQPRFYMNENVRQDHDRYFNHDVYMGAFDTKFMARNRVRGWNDFSFTIQAQAKNCPLHPQAPRMQYISPNQRIFACGYEHLYRRLSVRECARIQSFPDSFKFVYNNIKDGYKMVGNAVPPRLAKRLALALKEALSFVESEKQSNVLVAYYKNELQLHLTLQHKLYYVRTGFRRGALQMPIGEASPDYLLLHNGKCRFLFTLTKDFPETISASELTALGFTPLGGEYLAFKLKESKSTLINGLDMMNIKIRGTGKNTALPYITNIIELFNR